MIRRRVSVLGWSGGFLTFVARRWRRLVRYGGEAPHHTTTRRNNTPDAPGPRLPTPTASRNATRDPPDPMRGINRRCVRGISGEPQVRPTSFATSG